MRPGRATLVGAAEAGHSARIQEGGYRTKLVGRGLIPCVVGGGAGGEMSSGAVSAALARRRWELTPLGGFHLIGSIQPVREDCS